MAAVSGGTVFALLLDFFHCFADSAVINDAFVNKRRFFRLIGFKDVSIQILHLGCFDVLGCYCFCVLILVIFKNTWECVLSTVIFNVIQPLFFVSTHIQDLIAAAVYLVSKTGFLFLHITNLLKVVSKVVFSVTVSFCGSEGCLFRKVQLCKVLLNFVV